MKIKASLLAGLIASAPFAFAQDVEVATDPVGYVNVDLKGFSDSQISIPLHRAPVFQGIPVSVDGSDINFAQGTGLAPENAAYFVAIRSGDLAGVRASVVEVKNGGDTIEIEAGIDLSSLTTGDGGDPVQLIPEWTLSTLFPSDVAGEGDSVLVFPSDVPGVNLGAAQVFEYVDIEGVFTGWSSEGAPAEDQVIFQGETFIYRSAQDDEGVAVAGSVPMVPQREAIATLQGGTSQDVFVSSTLPVDIQIADLNVGSDGDQILVPANENPGVNKGAATVYEYVDIEGVFTGWSLEGAPVDENDVIRPGVGYIYRKAATPDPEAVEWVFEPTYQQN